MFIVKTALILLFCFFWTILLRTIATFLIKDCVNISSVYESQFSYLFKITLFFFSIIDFLIIIFWIFFSYKISNFIPSYALFLSALSVTIYTDTATMLISRFVSLYLVPVGIFFAWMHLLPITACESIMTAMCGYLFFWSINKIFYYLKGHNGLGQGDLELIAMIGSFIGIIGCWYTILCASLAGTILGCFCMIITKKSVKTLPFGPFLAFSSAIFVLYQSEILNYLTRFI